jgi:hypothetical protein
MIKDLRGYHRELVQQRDFLDTQVRAVETALGAIGSAMGGPVTAPKLKLKPGLRFGPPRKRAERGALKKSLMKFMRSTSGPVQVKDMIAGIKKVGYKTQSKSLGSQISMVLRSMPGLQKVSHGVYALKKK